MDALAHRMAHGCRRFFFKQGPGEFTNFACLLRPVDDFRLRPSMTSSTRSTRTSESRGGFAAPVERRYLRHHAHPIDKDVIIRLLGQNFESDQKDANRGLPLRTSTPVHPVNVLRPVLPRSALTPTSCRCRASAACTERGR